MIHNVKSARYLALLFLSIFVSISYGQQAAMQSPLENKMSAFVVVTDKEGKESLKATEKIFPGQTIEYVLTYANKANEPIRMVKIVGLVPENTEYLDGTATGVPAMSLEFSINQGISYGSAPVKYLKKLADGTEEEAIATPDMYTHLRWTVPTFAPGKSMEFRYRVRVK